MSWPILQEKTREQRLPLSSSVAEALHLVVLDALFARPENSPVFARVLEQTPYLVTCANINKTKMFHIALGEIAYFYLKPILFFGYQISDCIPVAWPEKAALNYIRLQKQTGLQPLLDE